MEPLACSAPPLSRLGLPLGRGFADPDSELLRPPCAVDPPLLGDVGSILDPALPLLGGDIGAFLDGGEPGILRL